MVGPAGDLEQAEPTFPPLSLWNRVFGMVAGDYSSYFPISATSVPTFWAMARNESNHDEINIPFYFACLAGAIFGGIHCVAWTAGFPSTIEMWMWRSCSLLVAAIPVALGLFLALGTSIKWIDDVLGTILEILLFVSVPFYPIFRLFLVILPLTSLRALPPGAFIDIDWKSMAQTEGCLTLKAAPDGKSSSKELMQLRIKNTSSPISTKALQRSFTTQGVNLAVDWRLQSIALMESQTKTSIR
ncbi:hypothetical protein C8R44DRAFT_754221 [Mycena epipterygia]|nr:hypothetical protein C8R44DRAFT_754221 [Mycena epipterygia]